ncbi:MAG: hypothetical protein HYT48_00620 [Candidatus Vogelbacteria bacterium]|nr:hypothetical protein [Candidatus Vogelbacteria bacterium]
MNNSYFLNLEYIYAQILRLFTGGFWGRATAIIQFIFLISIPFLIISIFYVSRRLSRMRRAERERLHIKEREAAAVITERRNENWERVQKYLDSGNPAEWKLAIIEADTMLDEMVKKMNYPGENLGERLKVIEPSDFTNLDAAWEGHKVRNQIAHQGDFMLNKREAERVIGLFRKVFEEFRYI